MENSPQQNRTPVTYTERLAQNQARIDKNLRESNIIIRDFYVKRKGVDDKMFAEGDNICFWNRKNINDKELCTICLNPEFHKGLFPVYIGKRIIFKEVDGWDKLKTTELIDNELIVKSVIFNGENGITFYLKKANIFNRIFRREKPQIYYI